MMHSSTHYGHVEGDQLGASSPGNKKRIVTIVISSLVLVAMVVGVVVGVNHKSNTTSSQSNGNPRDASQEPEIKSSTKAIEAICKPTDYKKVCVDSLTSAGAENVTNPQELIKIGFDVTISKIREAAKNSSILRQLEKDPRTSKALEDCKELMDYAIGDLRHSLEQLGKLDMTKIDNLLVQLKVWLSASGTYLETCLDGFENTTGNAEESMRKALNVSSQLTSNALAIVTEISSVLRSLDIPVLSRRLLSFSEEPYLPPPHDRFPWWVRSKERRLLAVSDPANIKANVIVAQDGSGKYKSIGEALVEVPKSNTQMLIIYVKEGIYNEQVEIGRDMNHVMMIGDGPMKTTITGNKNFIDGTPTFKTATFACIGENFIAKDIRIENSAGPEKHQAVALRVQSDLSIFYNCQIDGYQDTLYTHTRRQFYRDCTISGTIDFIFGDAAAVFQNCKMVVRKPMDNQQNIVTAQGRKDRREPTGIVLQDCSITAEPAYFPLRNQIKSYLGRPWKEFSRTIIMNSQKGGCLGWVILVLILAFMQKLKTRGQVQI